MVGGWPTAPLLPLKQWLKKKSTLEDFSLVLELASHLLLRRSFASLSLLSFPAAVLSPPRALDTLAALSLDTHV